MALPYAEESMMICCDVCFYYKLICCLLERNERYERKPFRYNTTTRERQTDGRTDRIPISILRVGIAVLTRDKNRRDCWWQIGLRCKRQEAVRVSSLSNVHADHRTIKSASCRDVTQLPARAMTSWWMTSRPTAATTHRETSVTVASAIKREYVTRGHRPVVSGPSCQQSSHRPAWGTPPCHGDHRLSRMRRYGNQFDADVTVAAEN